MAVNQLHSQAIAMQYVGFLLQRLSATASGHRTLDALLADVSDAGGRPVVGKVILGCSWSVNIVTALALEMALKSLLQVAVGKHPYIHDLLELFDAIPSDLASRLNATYRQMSASEVPLRDLLETHRHDFVKWRYLDKDVQELKINFEELQLAVSAVLEHLGSA